MTYHCATSPENKLVDSKINATAKHFIWGCNHFTPAADAALDELLGVKCNNPPKSSLDVPDSDWMDTANPPSSAFDFEK